MQGYQLLLKKKVLFQNKIHKFESEIKQLFWLADQNPIPKYFDEIRIKWLYCKQLSLIHSQDHTQQTSETLSNSNKK